MDNIFVDTDVIIDFLIDRKPFSDHSAIIFDLADKGDIKIWISSSSINNVYYIVRKILGNKQALSVIKDLSEIIEIQETGKNEILEALNSSFKDLEDAIQYYSALRNKEITAIITRNIKDFGNSTLAVFTPEIYLKTIIKRKL